jgi:hypothetical protein
MFSSSAMLIRMIIREHNSHECENSVMRIWIRKDPHYLAGSARIRITWPDPEFWMPDPDPRQ